MEVEDEEEEVGGIISESVSASSVIQMFGGIGKFKKTASSGMRRENTYYIKMTTIKT